MENSNVLVGFTHVWSVPGDWQGSTVLYDVLEGHQSHSLRMLSRAEHFMEGGTMLSSNSLHLLITPFLVASQGRKEVRE